MMILMTMDYKCNADNNDKVDPAMMAALMAACSVIQTGANTEEVTIILLTLILFQIICTNGGERMKKCLFVFFMVGQGSGLCYLFLFIEVVPVTQNNQVVLELGICGQKNRSI